MAIHNDQTIAQIFPQESFYLDESISVLQFFLHKSKERNRHERMCAWLDDLIERAQELKNEITKLEPLWKD